MDFIYYKCEKQLKAINLELVKNIHTEYTSKGEEELVHYYFDNNKVATIKYLNIYNKIVERLTDKEYLKNLYNIEIDQISKDDKWKEEMKIYGFDYFCNRVAELEVDTLMKDIFIFEIKAILRSAKKYGNVFSKTLEYTLIDYLIANGYRKALIV